MLSWFTSWMLPKRIASPNLAGQSSEFAALPVNASEPDILAAAKQRLSILFEYFNGEQILTDVYRQAFEQKYTQSCANSTNIFKTLFAENIKNHDDTSILQQYRLDIHLIEREWGCSAEITAERLDHNIIDVYISCGFFFLIDLLSALWLTQEEIDASKATEKDRTSQSEYLISKARLTLTTPLIDKITNPFVYAGKKALDTDRWSKITSSAICWILLHEVGHLIAGHVAFYLTTSNLKIFGDIGRPSKEKVSLGFSGRTGEEPSQLRSSAELFADLYATLRLIDMQERLNWFDDCHDFLSSPLLATTIIDNQYRLYVTSKKSADKSEARDDHDNYPSANERKFSVYATCMSVAFPHYSFKLGEQKHFARSMRRLLGIPIDAEVDFNMWLPAADPHIGLICFAADSLTRHYIEFTCFNNGTRMVNWADIGAFVASVIAARHCLVESAPGLPESRSGWWLDMMFLAASGYTIFSRVMHPLNFHGRKDRLNDDAMDFINNWCYAITPFALEVYGHGSGQGEEIRSIINQHMKICITLSVEILKESFGKTIPPEIFLSNSMLEAD